MQQDSQRLQVINTLRAFAAFITCLYHFAWHRDHNGLLFEDEHLFRSISYWGIQGVYVFFVISGFVIPLSLYHSRYQWSYFFKFLAKRFIRLHPPYLASLLLVAVITIFFAFQNHRDIEPNWIRIGHHLFFTAPFFNQEWFLQVYWTLNIEFQYYIWMAIAFPLFIHRHVWLRYVTLLLFALSSLLFPHAQKHILFFHAPVFIVGILIFMKFIQKIDAKWYWLLMVISVYLVRKELSPETAWAVAFTVLIIEFIPFHTKWTDWMGDISYSVYLIHSYIGGNILWLLYNMDTPLILKVATMIGALLVSYSLGHLFWKYIEKPSMEAAKKIKYRD